MRCIAPIQLTRPVRTVVPCGRCNACLMARRVDWTFRLLQENKVATTATFLTLTYADDFIPVSEAGEYTLLKRDVQLWLKRLRKQQSELTPMRIRYYLVGEYGSQFGRPHYHALMFDLHPNCSVERSWQRDDQLIGFVDQGTVTPGSIHYVAGYILGSSDEYPFRQAPFSLMSKGVGRSYLTPQMIQWHRSGMRNFTQVNGFKARIPRYYKDRLFTAKERKLLVEESLLLADKQWHDEVMRLTKLGFDAPARYIDELHQWNVAQIGQKLVKKK